MKMEESIWSREGSREEVNELEDRNFEMTLLENKMKRANRLDMIYGIVSNNK